MPIFTAFEARRLGSNAWTKKSGPKVLVSNVVVRVSFDVVVRLSDVCGVITPATVRRRSTGWSFMFVQRRRCWMGLGCP